MKATQIMPYHKILKTFSRALRHNQTQAELLLWTKIRRRRIQDVQFLRQKPLKQFIIDFYAPSIRLAIELDGGQHCMEAQRQKDISRDAYLASMGIHTLRFTNLAILNNTTAVLAKISETILRLQSQ